MRRALAPWLWILLTCSACQQTDEPTFSFYEENISPIVVNGCARAPTGAGCHLGRPDGTSLGNLDLESYDTLLRRRDVLAAYGPYSVGLLLLKAGEDIEVQVETFDPDNRFIPITTDIRHNNGQTIETGSPGYSRLKQWIEAGHTRNGVPDETLVVGDGTCVSGVGRNAYYDPTFAERFPESFAAFRDSVQPVMRRTCAGGGCHSSTIADFYINCGDNQAELEWNFWVSVQHVTTPASTSGLLRRPLSTFRGGVFHEGGNIFASAEDEDYQVIRTWADDLVARFPEAIAPPTDISEGLRYFANRVQPVLVRKGCMFLNCHSVSMFHDLRLQGGSQGHFSRLATYRNYEQSLALLAPDASNPNESRIIAKNLYPPELIPGTPGLFHRGGSLLEDFSADGVVNNATPDDCAMFDADTDDLNVIPGYCIFVRWHEIEREEAIAAGEIFDPAVEIVRSVLWVSRPTGVGDARDFDTYRGGADLLLAPAMVDTTTNDLTIGAGVSILAGCGLDPSTADVRGPSVSWDGTRIAFSARSSGGEPLRLYWANSDGSSCERIMATDPASAMENGVRTHDFDPAWTPDGRIVFASARGNADAEILDGHAGPSRTPAAMQPNANIYIFDGTSEVRQMTYLLNQEIQPSMMTDGRTIFTAEKREPDFHQLAGRRQNLDGGDYHPLFAQRATVGYESATEIIELLDRNFAFVSAPLNAADGAGRIVIVNRSIGPDQSEARPMGDNYYIASQRFPGGAGVFRSPAALPTGRMIVSCDRGASDVTAGNFAYQLCELDPDSGALRDLGGAAGRADIEAVPIFARLPREVFFSRIDEANGNTIVVPGEIDAQVEVVDFPILATLLFENTRQGRTLREDIGGIDVYAEYPAPPSATTFGDAGGNVISDAFGMMYLDRRMVGHVDLNPDGSAYFRYRGGLPIVLGITGWDGSPLSFADGAPFSGEMIQREQMQFYPGERAHQSFRRELFNGFCGGCHGSMSNRELDVVVDIDVLTSASSAQSNGDSPQSLGL